MMDKQSGCIALIEDDDLLKKDNTIWNKVSVNIKNEVGSNPVYNKSFLKTKIKSHEDKVTKFQRNPKG